MEEIAPNIHLIDTEAFGNRRLVASYLIESDGRLALVDPGFPSSQQTVKEKLRSKGFDPSRIDHVLLTHFHLDHSGATGAILADAPGASVIVHKRAAFYVRNFAKITGGARMVFSPDLIRMFGEAYPVPAARVRTVQDGDVIDLGRTKIRVIHTPGHSADQVSFFVEGSAAVITGDVACLEYPDLNYLPVPAGSPPIFDLAEQVASLLHLKSVEADTVLIPHYGRVPSSWPEFIEANIAAIEGTRTKIAGMFREGIEFRQMIERLRDEILRASGKREEEVPEFLSEVYLREMLKTGLMGFFACLLEYAPYPRPFSNELCADRSWP